jgi:hypothetical protein
MRFIGKAAAKVLRTSRPPNQNMKREFHVMTILNSTSADAQETLEIRLVQANAIVALLRANFEDDGRGEADLSPVTITNALWAVSELLDQAEASRLTIVNRNHEAPK